MRASFMCIEEGACTPLPLCVMAALALAVVAYIKPHRADPERRRTMTTPADLHHAMLNHIYHADRTPEEEAKDEASSSSGEEEEEAEEEEEEAAHHLPILPPPPTGSVPECCSAIKSIVAQQQTYLAEMRAAHTHAGEKALRRMAKQADAVRESLDTHERQLHDLRAQWDAFHAQTVAALHDKKKDDHAKSASLKDDILALLGTLQADLLDVVRILENRILPAHAAPAPAAPAPAAAAPAPAPAPAPKEKKKKKDEAPPAPLRRSDRVAARTGEPLTSTMYLEEDEEDEDEEPRVMSSHEELCKHLRDIIDELTEDEEPTHEKLDELCTCLPGPSYIDLADLPVRHPGIDPATRQCELASFLTAQLAQLCNHSSAPQHHHPPLATTMMKPPPSAAQLLLRGGAGGE